MTDIGPHLLGRKPSPPDSRDLQLEFFLRADVSALEKANAVLQVSRAAKATKAWAAVVTPLLASLETPPGPPVPPPVPPAPDPVQYVNGEWVNNEPTLDQGNFGTCVGNGWAQYGNTLPTDDGFDEAAARAIYYEATVIDGQPDNPDAPGGGQQGSAVRSGAKAMQNRKRLDVYAFASTTDAITQWVTTQGPVVVGTDWHDAMFTPDANGYVAPTGNVAGGHCYLLRGFLPGEDAYWFLNSWGAGWGLGGGFKMKVSDFASLLAQQGEACVALELP